MKTMFFILNWFFDDYGFPSVWVWVFLSSSLLIFAANSIYFICNWKGGELPRFIACVAFFLYLLLFGFVSKVNPYKYIPFSGTDIQKSNLKRCTVGKTITLENIEDIMFDCKKHDLKMELKSITK